jgi:hypothetical protein
MCCVFISFLILREEKKYGKKEERKKARNENPI